MSLVLGLRLQLQLAPQRVRQLAARARRGHLAHAHGLTCCVDCSALVASQSNTPDTMLRFQSCNVFSLKQKTIELYSSRSRVSILFGLPYIGCRSGEPLDVETHIYIVRYKERRYHF